MLMIVTGLIYGAIAVVVLQANTAAAKYAMVTARHELRKPHGALPDVLHKLLPKVSIYTPDFAVLMALFVAAPLVDRGVVVRVLLSFLVRPLFVCSTQLPSPMAPNAYFHTHDLVFSGHTILYLAAATLLYNHNEKLVGVFVGVCGPLLSIAARQHYTLDILVAVAVWTATQLCV